MTTTAPYCIGERSDELRRRRIRRRAATAQFYHVSDESGALLVDMARGKGRIVVLSDPFIVANRGISRADNLQLAANIITGAAAAAPDRLHEYHQGLGATRNQSPPTSSGTPVLAMCAQLFCSPPPSSDARAALRATRSLRRA